ncbi:MAG: hypothetical protein JWM87_3195 [Candidatus Eremiobacteraeota bacterium]|nr:hypothetical protein [Candidatus Eremiobacteraeota bacterium]
MREVDASEEHVFPRWLLRRYDLYRHSFTLSNGSSFNYSRLTVPCCRPCNEAGERDLEGPISKAFRGGYEAVMRLDSRTIALWCLKIYYGIRFKEHALKRDPRRPERGKITSRTDLEEMNLLFMVLQGIRTEIVYSIEPWSVWIYKVKVPVDPAYRFSFADLVDVNMFSIRIGDVGIIVLPQDFGLVRCNGPGDAFAAYSDKELHPQQFNQLAADAAYLDILRRVGVTYLTSFTTPPEVHYTGSMSARPWREWNVEEYCRVAAFISKIPYERWHPKPGLFWNLLADDHGNFRNIPIDELPINPDPNAVWKTGPDRAP